MKENIESIKIVARKKGSNFPWQEMNIKVDSVEDAKAKLAETSEMIKKGLDLAIRIITLIEDTL